MRDPSLLNDQQWEIIRPLLPLPKRRRRARGRPRAEERMVFPALLEDINVDAELTVTLSFDRQLFGLFTGTIFDNTLIGGLIEDPVECAFNRAPTGARISRCEGSADFERQRIEKKSRVSRPPGLLCLGPAMRLIHPPLL